MSKYIVTDTELTSVANAIRTKRGTNADLEWPSDFVSAIEALSSGGGNTGLRIPPFNIPTSNYSNPLIFDNGWIGEFNNASTVFRPIDSQGNVLDVDWSKPFEIFTVFKRSNTSSHSMVLFGSETGNWSYTPSIELQNTGNTIWCGFSTNGSAWTDSITIGPSDGLTLQNDVKYSVKATWDGTDFTVEISDGTNTVIKSITPSATHYHSSSYTITFGGMMHSSNHNAQYVKLYLPEMYIKSEGVKIW